MDELDKEILDILQQNANLPVADIAKEVGLSTTPCWRRIQKLEEEGVIQRRTVILNETAINLNTTVFLSIRISSHNQTWIKKFEDVVSSIPEIVECYKVSGNVDYILKIMIPNIDHYDHVYQQIISQVTIHTISTFFVTNKVKTPRKMPLSYLTMHNSVDKTAAGAKTSLKKGAKLKRSIAKKSVGNLALV